ncbi:hypothetical protein [Geminisphaera colitermitum]|uniref:hypothetical protein n=1 Tax=Geminisphaera colitermitum TaxID=1148786 RepID=UPI0005BC13A4|nr:hypothetical protein [Geminisphaera colitermitum]
MKTQSILRLSASLLAASLLATISAPVTKAAQVFGTDFSTADGYSSGALDGQSGWSVTLGGSPTRNSFFIAESSTAVPQTPAGLAVHPASPSGSANLLWIGPRTANATSSYQNSAVLKFAESPNLLTETFSVSLDLYVGPQYNGDSGAVFNFGVAQSSTSSKAPLFRLHSGGSAGTNVSLRIRDDGTDLTGLASLAQEAWYRFELIVIPGTTAGSGTYGLSVSTLDSSGSVTNTVFSGSGYAYSGVSNGFGAIRIGSVSQRSDFWIDSITVATTAVPEPAAVAAVFGTLILLVALRMRRR